MRRALRTEAGATELGHDADYVALAAAVLWVVHPLNSESVSYLTERTESMMGLFYLTDACTRRFARPRSKRHRPGRRWIALAVAASALGMASKESMVTAPVMVLIFDRVFLYKTWREAWAERRALYAGLAASWVVLGLILWSAPRSSVGFESGATPWNYFLNQVQLIAQYLWLAVWPQALVLDYGLPRALTVADVILPGVVVVALGLLTLVALWRWPMLGFLGAWVFITLSPTSSFVPIATEVGAERRMYLPMAAAGGAVRGGRAVADRAGDVGGAACALAYRRGGDRAGVRAAGRTHHRPQRRIRLAHDDGRRPSSTAGRTVAGGSCWPTSWCARASTSRPWPSSSWRRRTTRQAHFGLATEMLAGGRTADAVIQAQTFIRLVPKSPVVWVAHDLMGQALASRASWIRRPSSSRC